MEEAPKQTEEEATFTWARRWLSPARLQPCLDDCDGDVARALELHEWNLHLGQAIMGDIAHFELALRNAYARVLSEDCGEGWLFDPKDASLSPRAVDADAVRLLRDLCPEAYENLFADDPRKAVECFLDEEPAPADVDL